MGISFINSEWFCVGVKTSFDIGGKELQEKIL